MAKLLKKEFSLAMHPVAPFMVLLAAMVIIPNYPYSVSFFYITLAAFFTCLQGRENSDIAYSMNLPVSRKDIVTARFSLIIILEAMQMVIMAPLMYLSTVINKNGNAAGLDASPALYGIGFIIFGLFHLCYFIPYYKNVSKVGLPFVFSSIAVFIVVIIEVISTYAIPFVRDYLDTSGLQHLPQKLIFTAVCFVFYLITTLIAYCISVKNFTKQDI